MSWPLRAADGLALAAAPVFALMALAAASGPPEILCSAAVSVSRFSGMVAMYALMSAFHSAPWLKLIAGRRGRERPDPSGR